MRNERIGIIGLGYVGLPLAVAFASGIVRGALYWGGSALSRTQSQAGRV